MYSADRPVCPVCGTAEPKRRGFTSAGSIRWGCRACGKRWVAERRGSQYAERIPEMVALRQQRLSYEQIGEQLGIGRETVRELIGQRPEVAGITAPRYLEAKRLARGGGYLSRSGETHARKAARERSEARQSARNEKWEKWSGSPAKSPDALRHGKRSEKRASEPAAQATQVLPLVVDPLRQPRRLHSGRDWGLRQAAPVPVHPTTPVPLPGDPWPTGPVCQQPPADCDRCLRPLPLMRRVGQTRHFECRGKAAPPVGITRVAGLEQRA